jgi:hypothetical protein
MPVRPGAEPKDQNQTKPQSRRIKMGGRTIILPPEGHGEIWTGSGGAR